MNGIRPPARRPTRPARQPARRFAYVGDGNDIYADSFATIRREADLGHVPADAEALAVRMVHGSGQVDLLDDLVVHPRLVVSARAALRGGAPILCDATMVAAGVTRSRLPAGNEVRCLLDDPRVPQLARDWGTTRSAAAVSLWEPVLDGAVVAVGNAPTALFHLLELVLDGGPRPAAVVGCPVGFVGAAESKDALVALAGEHGVDLPYVTVRGRRGGSAVAASALNALAQERE
ncbi:MAG: precorrin-8X methylmutase [Phycicoccus sp.]